MLQRQSIDQVFNRLQEDKENCQCSDCGCPSPVFAAVAYGSFICSFCASSHSSLSELSAVKSLLSNDWSLEELRRMVSGGNSALQEFAKHYEIDQLGIEVKYRTVAMKVYRRMLTEVCAGRSFEEELPSVQEGKISEEAETNWIRGIYDKTKSISNKAIGQIEEITNRSKIRKKTKEIISEIQIEGIAEKTGEIFNELRLGFSKGLDVMADQGQRIKVETVSLFKSIENGIHAAKNKIVG